jgi:hydrogenase expression/formation protein HypE
MSKGKKILLSHGSGGRLSHDLINTIGSYLSNPLLDRMDDAAVFNLSGKLAFTTDSYVVNPIFFPGGNIGKLAICGTINDLLTSGAKPLYISLAFIIEEGLPVEELELVLDSIRTVTLETDIQIITGDTKVVNKGNADRVFVNTSGIGIVSEDLDISGCNAQIGDKVLLSGSIGDHGMAIMAQREGLSFKIPVKSDCAPLSSMVSTMLTSSKRIHTLRDPTRGGLATTLNEIANQSGIAIEIDEDTIPIEPSVRTACELLGFDPLYVANEGKMVAIVHPEDAEKVLKVMKADKHGQEAAIIGEVKRGRAGRVNLRTSLGASRIVDMLTGELLPRIC